MCMRYYMCMCTPSMVCSSICGRGLCCALVFRAVCHVSAGRHPVPQDKKCVRAPHSSEAWPWPHIPGARAVYPATNYYLAPIKTPAARGLGSDTHDHQKTNKNGSPPLRLALCEERRQTPHTKHKEFVSLFDQVRIKIKHMEIEIRRRESTGSGASLCASARSEHAWSMRKYTRPYPARMHVQGCDCAPPSSPLAQADDSVHLDPSKCP